MDRYNVRLAPYVDCGFHCIDPPSWCAAYVPRSRIKTEFKRDHSMSALGQKRTLLGSVGTSVKCQKRTSHLSIVAGRSFLCVISKHPS
jgi:hypothetical protein